MTRPAAHYSLAITALMMPLVYYVVWRVLSGPFSPEVQSMVIGAVMSGGFMSVCGYWLGSSASSQRKDDAHKAPDEPTQDKSQ